MIYSAINGFSIPNMYVYRDFYTKMYICVYYQMILKEQLYNAWYLLVN